MPPLACGLPLPPAEWDFRALPEKYLLLASEYEYARSSTFGPDIKKWHGQDLRSALTGHPDLPPLRFLRKAGLVQFPDRSPFGRWVAFHQSKKFDVDRLGVLMDQLLDALPKLKWLNLTVKGAVCRVFDRLHDPEARSVVLRYIEAVLPDRVRNSGLARTALLFDRFSDPIMDVFHTEGAGYLEARMAFPLRPEQPIVDITTRPISYVGHLDDVASLRHHQFLVDWSAPGEKLEKAFASWVQERHPDSRSGRRARALRLQWLAAYRLWQSGWKYSDLKTALNEHFKSQRMASQAVELPRFDNQREWSEAVGRVKKLLGGNFIAAIRADFPGSAWVGVG